MREVRDLREVLITLSPGQFETFARDLKLLRELGAESNTQVIVEAVRERAAQATLRSIDDRRAA